ncbi:MAG: NADH-quinone oxidoreductase subunit D [bacterium]|jgi:NADH-quinone oxidoreductase subunit D|nr:NADH-quinone oxidoreductase subunit D [Planctomycetota bacterium]HIL52810.1 NADH-quinone oxidoreductase subunit D [Planctomycetota bacterium]
MTKQLFEYAALPTDADDPLAGDLMELNMGPSHPATHGVLRLKVKVDGEIARDIEPIIGYLHRGKEKACEGLGWRKFFVHTDRLDYLQPLANNVGYALALEKLAQLEVPERGQTIRVLLMEISRIMSHLIAVGVSAIDLGAVSIFFFTFHERERLYDVLDAYTGHRMNNTYVRMGGVYADLDESIEKLLHEFLAEFDAKVDEWESLLSGNRIWHNRNRGVGTISAEDALRFCLSGPNLRACGIDFDLRKQEPYSGYEHYDFEVPVGTVGDAFDRYLVRIEELRQSARICRQALQRLAESRGEDFLSRDRRFVLPPRGTVHTQMEELIHQFKIVTDMALPRGEAYAGIESSKGELGFFVASDGTSAPLRCHVRAPSLMNVQAIPLLAENGLISDLVAIIGSLDFVMGEVDR